MQKEINPDLFGEFAKTQPRQQTSQNDSSNWNHVLEVDRKIADLRGQIQGVAEQLSRTFGSTQENLKRQNSNTENLHQHLQHLAENFEMQQNEVSAKFQKVHSQLLENRDTEQKISSMVDRYQSVLRTYEVRINNLQRLIEEKDNQMMSFQSLLTEAKAEIARMKRL